MLADGQGVYLVLLLVLLLLLLAVLRWPSIRHALAAVEDPRTFALLRVTFAALTIWLYANMAAHWRMLYSDEGMYTLHAAQLRFGRSALAGWSAEHGFDGLGGVLTFLTNRPSLLYLFGSPDFVTGYMFLLFGTLLLFGLGLFTRTTGVLAWFLMLGAYNRNGAYHEGTDTVFRCFWFLLLFARTGHAWSLDNWLRCRRLRRQARLEDSTRDAAEHRTLQPVYRLVPSWPRYMFMLQLTLIYVQTGDRKRDAIWAQGDALYYSLNLERFYRFHGLTQEISALFGTTLFRLATWTTLYWERLFFVLLIGMLLRFMARHRTSDWYQAQMAGFRRPAHYVVLVGLWLVVWRVHVLAIGQRATGTDSVWVVHGSYAALGFAAAAYVLVRRRSPVALARGLRLASRLLSRRLWLGTGLLFHGFLIVFMNIGLFPFIVLATYAAFMTGEEARIAGLTMGHWLHRRFAGRVWLPAGWQAWFRPAARAPLSSSVAAAASFRQHAAVRTRTALTTAFVGYHGLAITLMVFNPRPPLEDTRDAVVEALAVKRWSKLTHTWQRWHMFARIKRHNTAFETSIVDGSGGRIVLENNLLDEKRPVELEYDRIRKLRARLGRRKSRGYRRRWAEYHCRELVLATGHAPKQVELTRVRWRIPSVREVSERGAIEPRASQKKRKRLGAYRCRGDGILPVYMKERHGFPITHADRERAARVRDISRRAFPAGAS